MPITNPTPISLAVADKLWVTTASITRSAINATLAPWDGQYLVGNPSAHKAVVGHRETDAALPDVIDGVIAVIATVAGKLAENFRVVSLRAADPARPVKASAVFTTDRIETVNGRERKIQETYAIADLFGACGENPAMAQAYGAVMAWIAGKIGG
jgi:hypothetical protein